MRRLLMWGCSPHTPGNIGCCIPNCASRRINKQRKGSVLLRLFIKMCVSPVRNAQREWPCHCRGVGAASAPTFKNLYANFPNIPRCFSAFSAPFLCPKGHSLGLNALRLRGGHGGDASPHIQLHLKLIRWGENGGRGRKRLE